ncbi:hypothetical protein EVAR_61093_1 [Eumeta japonica]|uniref:Uncharacterized protein n=1 Tax=Eumeta variegata TaxID=151549 RepID=A0A4C1YKZ4_EUMVA|nr:hypothetical protein EVAR_61093_1 [Eumeta japonica]
MNAISSGHTNISRDSINGCQSRLVSDIERTLHCARNEDGEEASPCVLERALAVSGQQTRPRAPRLGSTETLPKPPRRTLPAPPFIHLHLHVHKSKHYADFIEIVAQLRAPPPSGRMRSSLMNKLPKWQTVRTRSRVGAGGPPAACDYT